MTTHLLIKNYNFAAVVTDAEVKQQADVTAKEQTNPTTANTYYVEAASTILYVRWCERCVAALTSLPMLANAHQLSRSWVVP